MIIDSRVKSRLKKLKALIEHGVGGEADNAETILRDMLKKYNISESELGLDGKTDRLFNAPTIFLRDVLIRTLYNVCKTDDIDVFSDKGGKKMKVSLTDYEYAQTKIRYEAYRKSFKELVVDMQTAFLLKNKLFTNGETASNKEEEETTLEEKERLLRVANLERGFDQTKIPVNLIE